MAASKPFEFAHTVLIFLALIGVCVWIGMIIAARGEARLEQACKPLEFTTDALHQVAFALVGSQPVWTLYVQSYLMKGCYYFFSVVFSEKMTTGNSIFGTGEPKDQLAPQGGFQN